MKRFCLIFMVFCLLLTLAACGSNEEKPTVVVADPSATVPSHSYDTEEPTEELTKETETTDPVRSMYIPGNSFARVYRTETGAIWATVIMEFTNIGDMPLHFSNASIVLQGIDGEIFQTLEDVAFAPQVLAPGETGYYCETVELDTAEEISLSPKLTDFNVVVPVLEAPASYAVSRSTLSNSPYGDLVLQATVTNNTDKEGDLVCVTAILKNSALEPVGFITGYLDGSLAAGASAEIAFESFMLPGDLTAESVAEFEIFAYPILAA